MKCKYCNYDFDEYNDIYCPGCGVRIQPKDKIKPPKPLYGKKICVWALLLAWIFPVGWICGIIGYIKTGKNDLKEYRKIAITAMIIATIAFIATIALLAIFHDKIPYLDKIIDWTKKKK